MQNNIKEKRLSLHYIKVIRRRILTHKPNLRVVQNFMYRKAIILPLDQNHSLDLLDSENQARVVQISMHKRATTITFDQHYSLGLFLLWTPSLG